MGAILGGLKKEIVSVVRMFKPKTLHDATELSRMRDDNLSKDQRIARGEGTKQLQANSMQQRTSSAPAAWTYSSRDANKLSWE